MSIPDYQSEYDINTYIPIDISVLPEDANTSSFEYIVDGDSLIFSAAGIATGYEEGNYSIYVASGDIKSNVMSINVVDVSAREEALAKAEEERLAEEQAAKEAEEQKMLEEKAAKEAEEQRKAEEQAAKEAEERQAAEESEIQNQKLDDTPIIENSEPQPPAPAPEQTVQEPSSQNNATASVASGGNSNFNTYDNASQQQTEASYVLNTSTKKIHYPSCSSVKKIAPQNYSTSGSSVDELIAQGYSTCGICFK